MEMNNEGPYMHETRKKYAISPQNCDCDYITDGNAYEVLDDDGDSFTIIGDDGNLFGCLWKSCAHVNFGDWQLTYRDYETAESPQQTQIGGNHYTDMAIQPLTFAMANKLDACQTKIVKYTCRKKGNRLEDLEKARHVLDWYIDWIKQNEI